MLAFSVRSPRSIASLASGRVLILAEVRSVSLQPRVESDFYMFATVNVLTIIIFIYIFQSF
jgi:hypothetical protein